jgi:hypothetical protein
MTTVTPATLPTNVTTGMTTGHVLHSEEIFSFLHGGNQTLPYDITAEVTQGHGTHHSIMASLLGLSDVSVSDPAAHVAMHNAIHVYCNVGIRGLYGVRSSSADISTWPSSFDGTIGSGGTFASISAAATNGVANGVYRILPGTYSNPAQATVKAGQQFWGDTAGVTLSAPAGATPAFSDGGTAKAGVKIMNITFVGFTKQVDCAASGGWEVGYCDLSAYVGTSSSGGAIWAYQQTATPGVWVHHCKIHDSSNSVKLQDSTSGVLVEDCEIYNITGSDSWKPCLGTTGVVLRHNYIHSMDAANSARGIWYDFHNYGGTVEWNDISGADVGIEMEANPGSVQGGAGNIVRYNYVHGCNHHGIRLHGSSDHQVYGNFVGPNQQAAQVGIVDAEISMYINAGHFSQGSDLLNNTFNDNFVSTPNSGANKRGASLFVQAGTGQPDPTPYTNGTKNNQFLRNQYHVGTLLGSNTWYWNANKTFAQWQAVPQDAAGTAVA